MKKMISFLVFDIIVIEKGKYMEKNEEMEELKQKALVCVIVFLFVIIIGLLFIFNRFGSDVDAVSKALRDKEDFVVFFRSDDSSCSECSMVEERLNAHGISYYNFDVRVSSFSSVLEKLKINYEVLPPAIYVIKDGEVLYNITNIKDQKLVDSFIEENKLAEFSS